VLLFDEIEKAHPEVWNALLQILDDGRMTDGQGNVVDFRNTVLIMTSNLGTEFVRKSGTLGFLQQKASDEDREAHDKIERALKGTFRPEFLNRIDEIIMFSPLTLEQMEQIVDLQIKEVQDRLAEFGVTIELTPAARSWLAKAGYDASLGAPAEAGHPETHRGPLSVELLGGKFAKGRNVIVDVKDDKVVFKGNRPSAQRCASQQVRAGISTEETPLSLWD
jgi:ATP-dependent Clp protease ATP-binding subunit ClpC